MQALQAIYNAILCYGPFVLVGWATKRFLDGWAAKFGKHPSEVQVSLLKNPSGRGIALAMKESAVRLRPSLPA